MGLSPTNCDFSVWNGVPNVITEQVGNRCCLCEFLPVLCRFSLPAEFARPPNSSASQLIARCFIASLTVRIIAGIFPPDSPLLSSLAPVVVKTKQLKRRPVQARNGQPTSLDSFTLARLVKKYQQTVSCFHYAGTTGRSTSLNVSHWFSNDLYKR